MVRYLTPNTIAEILCFFAALFCLLKNRELVWKSTIVFLFITCITEITGVYLKTHHQANQWPYNILLVFQIAFNSWAFLELFNKYIKSKLLIFGGLALLTGLFAYEICSHGFFKFNELTYNTMAIVFVLYSLFYFLLMLKDDEYTNLRYSANFWWVAGVLLFSFGSTAVNISRGSDPIARSKIKAITQNENNKNITGTVGLLDSNGRKIHAISSNASDTNAVKSTPKKGKSAGKHSSTYYIYIGLNIILYGCWSYSFICRKWLTTISGS
jgi:hypothetical protein